MSARRTLRYAVPVIRDLISFGLGWYLIIDQAHAAVFNPTVFLGGMVIVGVPGTLAVFAARAGLPTGSSSSPGQLEASPPPAP